jgi:hypothetical protein
VRRGSTRVGALHSDGRGYFYGQAPAVTRGADGSFVLSDSAPLVRWPIDAKSVVTFGHIFRPAPPNARATAGGPVVRPGSYPVLLTHDRWAVSLDGRVAIVDHDPYSVAMVSPAGERRIGEPIPYSRQPVDDAVRRRFLAERSEVTTVLVADRNGNAWKERTPALPPPSSWAAELPPFRPTAFIAFDRGGTLWIQRTTFGQEGARYDLIGPGGELTGRVELPDGHRVAGFGRGALYVARRGADDFEHLQRLAWP